MKIGADLEVMKAMYTELNNDIIHYSNLFSALEKNMKAFSGWTGVDSTQYQNKVAELHTSIQSMIKQMSAFTTIINACITKYEATIDTATVSAKRI